MIMNYHSILILMVISFFAPARVSYFPTNPSDEAISEGIHLIFSDSSMEIIGADYNTCSPDRDYSPFAKSLSLIEKIQPLTEESNPAINSSQASTPTPPSPKRTRPPRNSPTVTAGATPTPEEIPQITDPRFLQSMIIFGIVAVVVILLGVYINRDRINPR
jgi:cell division septation protein DedD